jgi:riboflavin kinase / FMN adenylyltransferase
MLVHYNTDLLPDFRNAVLTIGTFDGVHSGHRQVIDQMKKRAADIHGETVIITFDPHPRTVINVNSPIRMINTMNEKIELFSSLELDHLVIVPFTESFAQLSAEDYISQFLIRHFHPHTMIIGYDHRFGKGRTGNYELLKKQTDIYQYELLEIPAHLLNSISVSSTSIRHYIIAGDIEAANLLLGYDYFFSGRVEEGNKLGRTIGYPTANLSIGDKDKLIPGDGVYAADIIITGEMEKAHRGMMNIGFRPTVDGTKKIIEVNIFDFNRDIYGDTIRIIVRKFIRREIKFKGLDELKTQLKKDKEIAENI